MPTTDMKVVKGVNIAIIVLAALATLGSLAFVALFVFGGSMLSDPYLYEELSWALGGDYHYLYGYGGIDGAAILGSIIGLTIGLVVLVFAWCLICSALTLVSGILGVRNANNPAKLKGAFAWAIVGAVAALLSGRFITLALLIVSAIFIYKVRKAVETPQPMYYYAAPQPGYQQPYNAAPQQPAYAQPYAPAPESQPFAPVAEPQFYASAPAVQAETTVAPEAASQAPSAFAVAPAGQSQSAADEGALR